MSQNSLSKTPLLQICSRGNFIFRPLEYRTIYKLNHKVDKYLTYYFPKNSLIHPLTYTFSALKLLI